MRDAKGHEGSGVDTSFIRPPVSTTSKLPGIRGISGSVYLRPRKHITPAGARARTMRVHPHRETMTKRAPVNLRTGDRVEPHRSLLSPLSYNC